MIWLMAAAMAAEPTWAMQIDVASSSQAPFVGQVHVLTRSLALARWAGDPSGVRQQHEVCDVRVIDDTRLARTTIPRAFVDALPRATYAVTLTGAAVRMDQGVSTLGFHGSGPVPTDDADPRVLDPDGDGAPGVTVRVKVPVFGEVSMYVVQRGHTVLEGTRSGDRIEGSVKTLELSQHTLGASHKMFAKDGKTRVVDAASTFQMWRVPESSTCGDLLATWSPGPTDWVIPR